MDKSLLAKKTHPQDVSDEELRQVIADFLAMGHVDNIVAMFRQEPRYYDWVGEILADERYAVRLGLAVLFEELMRLCPQEVARAIPGLIRQLASPYPWLRGEAASLLAQIGTTDALAPIQTLLHDASPQVAALVHDILELPYNP